MDLNKREYVVNVLKKSDNSKVIVAGWVERVKSMGNINFINLRDRTGVLQIVASGFKEVSKLTPESVIMVSGIVKKGMKKSGEKELELKEFEVINKAETPLPIDLVQDTTQIDKRIDYRHLDLHNPKIQAVFKIQSEILHSFREYFYKEGFVEFQTPNIISASSEGGTEMFEVKYFNQKAYLAQSPQLYKQMGATSLEKVTMVVPVWRAEKHDTVRHLNESRQMDMEEAFKDEFGVMKRMEECIPFMIKEINNHCKDELKLLNVDLNIPKFKYLSYEETMKLLKLKFGEDLSPENEKELCKKYPETVVFVHDWPLEIKPFYIMPKDKKLCKGFDAIYKGMEISSGGQRIHLPDLLIERIKAKGLNPKNFQSYINSFRHGAPMHSGWSIGLERFTMGLLGLSNIREAVLFPRDRYRLTP
jgi:aspartyl-tRNA synthetase